MSLPYTSSYLFSELEYKFCILHAQIKKTNQFNIMAKITETIRTEVTNTIYDFFAEECEVDLSEINKNTSIINDLDGDSLMFLELIEIFKKKYNLNIELKTIGKHSVKNPVDTIGELIQMQLLIIEHENNIINLN